MASAAIEVLSAGLLTTIQDTIGREPFGHLGVSECGALDGAAARAANALVGNPTSTALLEATLVGPTLRFMGGPIAIALAGADLSATLDGRRLKPGWSTLARNGSVLQLGRARAGARAYLSVGGGLQVPPVLGSRATDIRAGMGGMEGRALRAGDRLEVGPAPVPPGLAAGRRISLPEPDAARAIRVLPGPHADRFLPGSIDRLCEQPWIIDRESNRMGLRLSGSRALPRRPPGEDVVSLGLPLGAVQVPGSGFPIVLLADRQPTGGYPVLACVIRADVPSLAQRVAGDRLRFRRVTRSAAAMALRSHREPTPETCDAVWMAGLRATGFPG